MPITTPPNLVTNEPGKVTIQSFGRQLGDLSIGNILGHNFIKVETTTEANVYAIPVRKTEGGTPIAYVMNYSDWQDLETATPTNHTEKITNKTFLGVAGGYLGRMTQSQGSAYTTLAVRRTKNGASELAIVSKAQFDNY